jgi:hypothetical protein
VAALDIGTQQTVVLGEIVMAHVADEFITDRTASISTRPR